ncbi:DNA topoisomerase III [Niveispirillum sp. SYP-B3756]|uniref:DNA topoisomerase n=1 Tax=Niveispirillum sp. SYP-B3756 TaxID=2662178 RepID=UPI0012911E60|nr:DNA topoisomerase [Niveispirillum sp. SYP-B3756]MQP68185.1 DNA topoisomerase III [Niveispirillum sp. SYP-B3756]
MSIVLTEKPSQRRNVIAAVGSQYGEVHALQGHLLRLAEPEEVNPHWKAWTYDVLIPPAGLYPWRPDDGGGKPARLKTILQALKQTDLVFLATDPDREGQLIGEELLDYAKFRGRVMRVTFNAEDKSSIRTAFGKARPNAEFRNLREAAIARQQADQIYNLSLTRGATIAFRKEGARGAVGVGRVMTATLAIVCRRQLERDNFVAKAYFVVTARCNTAAGSFQMRRIGDTLTDEAIARSVALAAGTWSGPLSVEKSVERQAPPMLFDIAGLIAAGASAWSWSAERTAEVAQSLYQEHKLITYIGSDAKYLPEVQASDAPALVSGLAQLGPYKTLAPTTPTIRSGKGGHYWDKGLEGFPHHAIVPNVNVLADHQAAASAYGALSGDEHKLFDLIARRYLAAVSGDFVFNQTIVKARVSVHGAEHVFEARGRVPLEYGWRGIWQDPADDQSGKDTDDDKAVLLPEVASGSPATLADPRIEAKKTKPPPNYTEGTLVTAMKEAWRFVDTDAERDRLKEARGIGTARTQPEVLKRLKVRGQLTDAGKYIVPTQEGMGLFSVLSEIAPRVVNPAITADLEDRLDGILLGKAKTGEILQAIATEVGIVMERFQGKSSTLGGDRPPKPAIEPIEGHGASCPACGTGRMITRKGRGMPFLGCSAYPNCKHAIFPDRGSESDTSRKAETATGGDVAYAMDGKGQRIYLTTEFEEKDTVKRLGARFDGKEKRWYIDSSMERGPFERWLK